MLPRGEKKPSCKFGDRLPRRAAALPALAALLLAGCAQPQAQTAPQPPPPPIEYVGQWGTRGSDPGQINHAVALATDSVGNVFLIDPGNRTISKFAADGTPLLSFEDDRLASADDLAVDSGGAIYATAPERGSVLVYFPDGEFYREYRRVPPGKEGAHLGIAVDLEGNIFLGDGARHRILRLNRRGRLGQSWPLPQPGTIGSVLHLCAAPDGTLFVLNGATGWIGHYTEAGVLTGAWKQPETQGSGAAGPFALGQFGKFLLVADSAGHAIQTWSRDGQFTAIRPLTGAAGAEPPSPAALIATPRDELFLLDSDGARVLRYRLHF